MSTSNRRRTYASSKGKYDYEGVLCVDYNSAIWSSPDGINWTKLGTKPSTISITDKINTNNHAYTFNAIENIVWLHDDVYAFLLNLTYSSGEFPMVVEGTISQLLAGTATRKWGTSNTGQEDRYLGYAHRFYGTNKALFGVSGDRSYDGLAYSEWLDLPSSAAPNYVDMNDTVGTNENILDRVYYTTAYNSSCIYDNYVFSRINVLSAGDDIYLFRHPVKGGWSNSLNCYTFLKTYAGDHDSECYEVCCCNNRLYVGVREYGDSDGTTIYRIYYTNANPSSDERQNLSTSYTSIGGWTDGAHASMSATDTEVHIYRDRKHYTLTGTSLTTVNSSMTSGRYPCNFGVFRIKDTYISSYNGNNVIYSTDLNTWTKISQNFYPSFFAFIGEVGS